MLGMARGAPPAVPGPRGSFSPCLRRRCAVKGALAPKSSVRSRADCHSAFSIRYKDPWIGRETLCPVGTAWRPEDRHMTPGSDAEPQLAEVQRKEIFLAL